MALIVEVLAAILLITAELLSLAVFSGASLLLGHSLGASLRAGFSRERLEEGSASFLNS